MTGRNPRSGQRERADRAPGWADALLAGRSRADKEAEQDAFLRAIIVVGGVVVLLLVGLHALFTAVGLQLGWWAAPVFAPSFAWLLVSAGLARLLRPVALERLRWRERLTGGALLAVLLWTFWPLWAGPAAHAWKTAHGGFGGAAGGGPRYPLGAVLAASPVAMGMVAFLLLAVAMVLAPRVSKHKRERPAPPADPQPLRAPLVSQTRPERRPQHPRWP